jgi:hypothetical protein
VAQKDIAIHDRIKLKGSYLETLDLDMRRRVRGVLIVYGRSETKVFASVDGTSRSDGVVCSINNVYKV